VTVSIDENALKMIEALQRPGKPDLLARIVGLFKTETPKTLSSMVDGIDSMDMEEVRVAAHTLKSSSAYIGALELSERCKALERAALEQNFPACIALGDGVEDLFADSCTALDQRMSKAA
jgi:HPt (histidine-containing phosphotransfer) domain-containing protein